VNKHSRHKEKLLDALLREALLMLRGSLVQIKGRCGKPNCVCARDPSRKHTRYYLSYSEKGKTQMVYLPKKKVAEVRKATEAWKRFKEISEEITRKNLKEFKMEKKR